MEEKPIEYGTRIGDNIKHLPINPRSPDIKINACASCDKSLWKDLGRNGAVCFCTVSHEYTFKYDKTFVLHEQVYACPYSRLTKTEKTEKEEINELIKQIDPDDQDPVFNI